MAVRSQRAMSFMNAFDTNIFVYACDNSDPRRQALALDLLEATSDAVLLWQVTCEFIAASRKLTVHGFTVQEAWENLADWLASTPLVLPSEDVLRSARVLHVEQHWSFWDAMIVSACLDAGVTRLYSEDLPGRAAPDGLEIINPFA